MLTPWGEPLGLASRMPAFREDAGNTADEQALQMGMHHDGMAFFALHGSDHGDRPSARHGGLLWIQTDMAAGQIGQGELQRMGHNLMLASDPSSGEVRRFMTGPVNCELTGATMAPDGCTLFVHVQHPGDPPRGWRAGRHLRSVAGRLTIRAARA